MKPSILLFKEESKLIVPTTTGMQFIPLNLVIYFEADNIYTRLFLKDKRVLNILASIKCLEDNICNSEFIRIHKKYLVALDKIQLYSKSEGGYVILQNNIQLPVSRHRKEEFKRKLGL